MSPACQNCYAEAWAKRVGEQVWGANSHRRFFGNKHWLEPIKWNTEAQKSLTRPRIFCASMADVFEDRNDLDFSRERLWDLIEATQSLDWLLLTKRPDLVRIKARWKDIWPSNVWLGTTVENQPWARKRLPELIDIPAAVRFISAEPLLGPIDLSPWKGSLDWVITGGESGPKARPSSPTWFIELLNQCRDASVPFHFKQWGDWVPEQGDQNPRLRSAHAADGTVMLRVGKKVAGRTLEGQTWDGLPQIKA